MNFVVKQMKEKRVFFDYDKSDISEAGADTLLDVMEVLQDDPNVKVTLIGHTDNRGSYEYNVALGARRADAAKNFMVSCTPYLENRIKTASKGETEPLVYVADDSKNSKYEKEHAKNRRVCLWTLYIVVRSLVRTTMYNVHKQNRRLIKHYSLIFLID